MSSLIKLNLFMVLAFFVSVILTLNKSLPDFSSNFCLVVAIFRNLEIEIEIENIYFSWYIQRDNPQQWRPQPAGFS